MTYLASYRSIALLTEAPASLLDLDLIGRWGFAAITAVLILLPLKGSQPFSEVR